MRRSHEELETAARATALEPLSDVALTTIEEEARSALASGNPYADGVTGSFEILALVLEVKAARQAVPRL